MIMPLFHDEDTPMGESPTVNEVYDMKPRRISEESIRTEFCEGPLLVDEESKAGLDAPTSAPTHDPNLPVSDRQELIERIKRGESPTWAPHGTLGALMQSMGDTTPPLVQEPVHDTPDTNTFNSHQDQSVDRLLEESLASPAEIVRPRSALHSGDFRDEQYPISTSPHPSFSQSHGRFGPLPQSSNRSWAARIGGSRIESETVIATPAVGQPHIPSRPRVSSLSSYSSSIMLHPPTSPLAYALNTDDQDLSPTLSEFTLATSNSQPNRRHTLPHRVASDRSGPGSPVIPNFSKPLPFSQKEHTTPYQAHQPRRSLATASTFHGSSPSTIAAQRPRRPSLSSEISPLHHAPMVGSYEESILRGRMSTTPSRPLNFVAKIGVLGLGQCRSSLKCPAHISVPFPAVFYSYNTSSSARRITDDDPSPYVGLIDLENSVSPYEESKTEKRRRRQASPSGQGNDNDTGIDIPSVSTESVAATRRRREKQMRRSGSSKAPPGGCYRIPQTGQLQIVIKNPNKTAVKLFLVPYDLTDMEPGTKTFIRQRSYSTGAQIDLPISPNAAKPPKIDDRPSLRYLIHLHICSPSRGRFFLYKGIRVVFANRVPDGKENLRNEIQLPEPRYSAYRPSRDSIGPSSLSMDNNHRRRSLGVPFPQSPIEVVSSTAPSRFRAHAPPASSPSQFPLPSPLPIEPIPFSLVYTERKSQRISKAGRPETHISSSVSVQSSSQGPESLRSPPRPFTASSNHSFIGFVDQQPCSPSHSGYDKLARGDAGYGGLGSVEHPSGEGLLARKLKKLDVQLGQPAGPGETNVHNSLP